MRSNITKAIRYVQKKLPDKDITVKEANQLLFGGKMTRDDLNKQQNNLVERFVDAGYCNLYNMDRIMAGKVKAFRGINARQRLLIALEGLYQFCD